MSRNTELPSLEPEDQVTPQEINDEEQVSEQVAEEQVAEEQVETPQIKEERWDPRNLTLGQIASVKYRPLGGKG